MYVCLSFYNLIILYYIIMLLYYYIIINLLIYIIYCAHFLKLCFLPLRYIAKNPIFAHFPPFSATFSTLLVYLYHRGKENAPRGFVLAYFVVLQAFVLFAMLNVHYTLNVWCICPLWRAMGRVPPIPATKGSATAHFVFGIFGL